MLNDSSVLNRLFYVKCMRLCSCIQLKFCSEIKYFHISISKVDKVCTLIKTLDIGLNAWRVGFAVWVGPSQSKNRLCWHRKGADHQSSQERDRETRFCFQFLSKREEHSFKQRERVESVSQSVSKSVNQSVSRIWLV